jgi:hypothetical protein
MIGLAIILILIVACFALITNIIKAYEESEKMIRLQGIQTPEQKVATEELKDQWLLDFSKLVNESQNRTPSN